jgi:hypothetical protein
VLAGGAVVEAAVPEWLLLAAIFPSAGAAPVELRRGSAGLALFAAPRSAREVFPFAGVRGLVDLAIDDLKVAVLKVKVASLTVAQGGGAMALRSVRLPVRDGEPPSPRSWRWCGGFRRRGIVLDEVEASAQKDLVVFSLFSGRLCKSLG